MNDKEKYLAEIESRLSSFNTTIEEITNKAKLRSNMRADIDLDNIQRKHQHAHETVQKIRASDVNDWDAFRTKVDQMMGDINEDLRAAMANFH